MSQRVHMIGIGGISMSALAKLLRAQGVPVSGSDLQGSHLTKGLERLGAQVTIGHRAELVEGASRVVISDAIHADNPELRRAQELGLPVQRRSELLAELMAGRRGIAIAGTHGKTTVTAMVGLILVQAGMDPTVMLGGEYPPLDGNARVGRGDWIVAEACEAYESYLHLRPDIAVVTNVEADHLDHHKTEARLRASFSRFLDGIRPGGCAVLCADRPELHDLAGRVDREVVTYGFGVAARVRGIAVAAEGLRGRCHLLLDERDEGELTVGTPGVHNVLNALGAVAAAWRAGAPIGASREALARFSGVERRFEVLGEANGLIVVDDYAHHPTELSSTIATARSAFAGKRLVAAFQPHLYSRTRDFADGFAAALSEADLVVMTDIYPAREAPLAGVSSRLISDRLRRGRGEDAVCDVPKEQLAARLQELAGPGDVLLMMGAGDIGQVARDLARHLGLRPGRGQEVAATK